MVLLRPLLLEHEFLCRRRGEGEGEKEKEGGNEEGEACAKHHGTGFDDTADAAPPTIDSSGPRQTHSTRMTWWRRRLGRTISPADAARESWRKAWTDAAAQPDCGRVASLQTELEGLALPEEEVELEREMLEGLAAVCEQLAQLEVGLPSVATGHRVIGTETCHFSAPAFMPDEPSQPAGRLLFTGARAVFVGGGKPSTIPWHSIAEVHYTARDILLVCVDRARLYRFRANSYADALCATQLALRLMPKRSRAR